ncbi:MAG: hypothetical protein K8S16_04910 [Bacteroidales bacterium]|nr:hypothetical protein [Bacteroidales bacterium]
MAQVLFWIYLSNLTLLICHEIDSAYWKEWKLFGINKEGAIQGFVLAHIPVLLILILGLVWIYELQTAGMVMSLVLAFSGIFAFFFHFYHLRKGRPEFNNWVSKSILIATLTVSVFQAILTLILI